MTILVRRDRPARVGKLVRRDSSSTVQWVNNCKGEKEEVTSGGIIITLRVLEHIGDGASRQNTFGGWRTCEQTG